MENLNLKALLRNRKLITVTPDIQDSDKQYIRRATLAIISKTHLGMRSVVIDEPYNQKSGDDISEITNEIMKYVNFFDPDNERLRCFTDDVILELRTIKQYGSLGCLYMDVSSSNEIEIASFLAKMC